jgi:hypothetical protein
VGQGGRVGARRMRCWKGRMKIRSVSVFLTLPTI